MSQHNFPLRLSLVALLGGVLLAGCPTTTAQAQTTPTTITVSFKQKDMWTVLNYIVQKGGYQLEGGDAVRQAGIAVTVDFDETTPAAALALLFENKPFLYTLDGKHLRVVRNAVTAAPTAAKTTGQAISAQATSGTTTAQQTVAEGLRGIVRDGAGHPVMSANVQLKGTKFVAMTQEDGTFVLPTTAKSGELLVSSIGYQSSTVKFTNGVVPRVTLRETSLQLGEATVVAYGERNSRELVGAVSSIKAEKLKDAPAPSIQNLLQGQLSGLAVTNVSGSPGGTGARINIRGISSLNDQGINDGTPLFVVDGVPISKVSSDATGGINALAGLDPTTIESVEVLKDAASASLYGSRSGNGVILITTKKGRLGRPEFGVTLSQSLSFLPATPLQMRGNGERYVHNLLARHQRYGYYDYLTGNYVLPNGYGQSYGRSQYGDGAYDYFWGNGNVLADDASAPGAVQDSLNSFYNNNTNWWKYFFQVGKVTSGNFYARGGTDNARYLVSLGLYDETGIQINSGFQRLNFLTNLDLRLSPKLNFFTRVNLSYAKQIAISGSSIQGLEVDPKQMPTVYPGAGSVAEQQTVQRIRDVHARNGMFNPRLTLGADYTFFPGLKFQTTASADAYFSNNHQFRPTYLNYNNLSSVETARSMVVMMQWENILTYKFKVKEKNNFELMGGFTTTYDLNENIKGKAAGGPTNRIFEIGEGWPQGREVEGRTEYLQRLTTNREEQQMMSYLGRFAYNYDRRYLLEASIRYDGSSVFGSDVRWASFPSVAAGWAFSQEDFMRDIWYLSYGKFRASWGRSGQKFQEAYLAHGLMEESNIFMGESGLQPSEMANSHLTWEKSDQYDLGLDLEFLNSRLKVRADYYYKYSHDLLMQVPTPGNFFISRSTWTNASSISNEGLELDITASLYRSKDFTWDLGFNISRNWNKFLSSYDGKDLNDKVLGRPMYGIYTYHDEGIVQNESQIPYYYSQEGKRVPLSFGALSHPLRPGGRKIKDQNGDGIINSGDLYYAGSALPIAQGGITNTLTYKNFALTVLTTYTLGQRMMNMVKGGAFLFNKKFGVVMNDFTKAKFWKQEGDLADYPSLEFSDDGYVGQFDGDIDSNIEKVSYLRLKQLTLSYTLPAKITKALRLTEGRIYFTGENLFLLTNYSGLDPEIVNPATGKDNGTMYPLNRKLTLGLNFKF
jgi:tonB-linked outer membrane protein, susC/ragA family